MSTGSVAIITICAVVLTRCVSELVIHHAIDKSTEKIMKSDSTKRASDNK